MTIDTIYALICAHVNHCANNCLDWDDNEVKVKETGFDVYTYDSNHMFRWDGLTLVEVIK